MTTIANFHALLVSKLTQYDVKESVRYPNLYRLGHLLEASQRALDCCGLPLSAPFDAPAAERYKAALAECFADRAPVK